MLREHRTKRGKRRSAVQRLLLKVGVALLLLWVGLVLTLYILHQNGFVNAWRSPLGSVGELLWGSGVVCLLASWILGVYQKKQLIQSALAILIGINAIAWIGAYVMTHHRSPGELSLGVARPVNSRLPSDIGLQYTTQRIVLNHDEWLETWLIDAQHDSQGTVLLFPGKGGSKGKQLLAPAQVFHSLGYDSILVDFRGVGGSSGNTTTLGFREGDDVALAFNYAQQANLKRPIVLYGISMGSAAILKAIAQNNIKPDAIILELPFARLLDAVRVRFQPFSVPSFPMAELLVFWGSVQQGFNGFAHNPLDYAERVSCPTLILQGEQDKWMNREQIDKLFQNLQGPKQFIVFPTAGHNLLVTVDRDRWQQNVERFLQRLSLPKQ